MEQFLNKEKRETQSSKELDQQLVSNLFSIPYKLVKSLKQSISLLGNQFGETIAIAWIKFGLYLKAGSDDDEKEAIHQSYLGGEAVSTKWLPGVMRQTHQDEPWVSLLGALGLAVFSSETGNTRRVPGLGQLEQRNCSVLGCGVLKYTNNEIKLDICISEKLSAVEICM